MICPKCGSEMQAQAVSEIKNRLPNCAALHHPFIYPNHGMDSSFYALARKKISDKDLYGLPQMRLHE